MEIERDEDFDKFYKRIKPAHIEKIDVKKEMQEWV
jgi:hypothetical protein